MSNMPSSIRTFRLSQLIVCLPHISDNQGSSVHGETFTDFYACFDLCMRFVKQLLGINYVNKAFCGIHVHMCLLTSQGIVSLI